MVSIILLIFLVYTIVPSSGARYVIKSSQNDWCPQSPCITLSQFANISMHYASGSNISLLLLSGQHNLDQEFTLANVSEFIMSSDILARNEETVVIECTDVNGRVVIKQSSLVVLSGLHFVGCTTITASQVEQLLIQDTTFQGEKNHSMTLLLNSIANANILRSSFLNSTKQSMFESPCLKVDGLESVFLELNSSRSTGGTLYVVTSNISINGCKFMWNRVDIGGVLSACSSHLNISNSMFTYNTATFGGVMTTSKSTVTIGDSFFVGNTAEIWGAVVVSYNDSFTIKRSSFMHNCANGRGSSVVINNSVFIIMNSTFEYNVAQLVGGVMYAVRSLVSMNTVTCRGNQAKNGNVIYALNKCFFSIYDSTFKNNYGSVRRSTKGGVIYSKTECLFNLNNNTFANNSATYGGVLYAENECSFIIENCAFIANSAFGQRSYANGGVLYLKNKCISNVLSSTFTRNSAKYGGVMYTDTECVVNIHGSTFNGNSAVSTRVISFSRSEGGVLYSKASCSLNVTSSEFTGNWAKNGGVIYTKIECLFSITYSNFADNRGSRNGGVIYINDFGTFNIRSSTFTNNSADINGGVIFISSSYIYDDYHFGNNYPRSDCSFIIINVTFAENMATNGGVIHAMNECTFNISSSLFVCNSASSKGGVMVTEGVYSISASNFTHNSAGENSGVISCLEGSLVVEHSRFLKNTAYYGGILFATNCFIYCNDSTFDKNTGSLYVFNSNLSLSNTVFESCNEPSKNRTYMTIFQEGGAITSFQSTVILSQVVFLKNRASSGGAMIATESIIFTYASTVVTYNRATHNGGGISLRQSTFNIKGDFFISHNYAAKGGGIHATSSTINVFSPAVVFNNSAISGGGIYLEVKSKLNLLKLYPLDIAYSAILVNFEDNYANVGGALYVADETSAGSCIHNIECFFQILALYTSRSIYPELLSVEFIGNAASSGKGSNIFGGLLDRCIPSPFAEIYLYQNLELQSYIGGFSYFQSVSNITPNSISSKPLGVCFCDNRNKIDCSYQPPTIIVKKGETFAVSLAAVDQVNHSVNASIISSLSSFAGGLGESQQNQVVGKSCTVMEFNVYSPYDSETIVLYADGPCGNTPLSTRQLKVNFLNCTCPVGFKPSKSKDTQCECVCDHLLSPYITDCNPTNNSLVRVGTNSWITYINDTCPPGYIIHPSCPFDYCHPSSDKVHFDLNHPDGADAQCVLNRGGLLCGMCKMNLSLSLGSSRCLCCENYWPAVFIAVIVTSLIAGILLVTALLVLNMTVAVGLISGFIFYANVVVASDSIFFPSLLASQEPSFPAIFIAWLNLEIGFDICFFDGLDKYAKTWLQLAFPLYIITLVITVIVISKCSTRFAKLIGRKDPVATLATLILLSYAKLLSVTITALSFGVLYYPDGSRKVVWLPDSSVKYFQGKHIPLVIMALLILLAGVPYTAILFLWQWLVRAHQWKIFKWTANTKLYAFVSTYHAPYENRYRFWTGLLLIVRIVLYIIASMTSSSNPQLPLLLTIIIVGSLFVLKGSIGLRVYKKTLHDILEIALYFNILALASISLYNFKASISKQRAIAYTSTIITFLLLIAVIVYHVTLLIPCRERVRSTLTLHSLNEYLLPSAQCDSVITYSVIDRPKSPIFENDKPKIIETTTLTYQ